jgi:hypothetical protein
MCENIIHIIAGYNFYLRLFVLLGTELNDN